MNVVIVEDEPLVSRNLEKLLLLLAPDFVVAEKLTSVEASIHWFKSNPSPDLVFLDIQLSDGISFDIFNRVQIECPIIFTTAYNEYALRAFKVNSVDYLLKPIDKDELNIAIAKFRKWKTQGQVSDFKEQISQLIEDIHRPKPNKRYKERFLVWQKHAVVPLDQSKVSHLYKEEIIYLKGMDGQKYITDYHTMDELEEILNPELFFRANRQTLLHLQSIDSYQSGNNGKIVVKLKASGSPEVEISREKAGAFKDWLS